MLEPPNNGVRETLVRALPQQSESKPATPAATVGLDLLKQLPQKQLINAQVVEIKSLQQKGKQLLQITNPSLAKQLAQQLASGDAHKTPSPQAALSASTNAPPTNILSSEAITQLLNKVELFLVKLHINRQALLTVTPQALSLGDTVSLSRQHNHLQISQLPPQAAITDQIKQVLPKQQAVSQLQQWLAQFQQLPSHIRSQALSQPLTDTLQLISKHVHSQQQLASGEQLKLALQTLMSSTQAKWSTNQVVGNDLPLLIEKALKLVTEQTLPRHNSEVPIQQVTDKPLPTAILSSPTQTSTKRHEVIHLLRLLGVPVTNEQNVNNQITLHLQQQLKNRLEQSQAKLQLNQLQSLIQKEGASYDHRNSLIQSLHTEISLRFNEQVLPLQVTIEEREHYDEACNDDETGERVNQTKERCWHVFLSFDLPGNEKLHSQIQLIQDDVSATLWAESYSLCNKTKMMLHSLRDRLSANGLNVSDLHCVHGKPHLDNISLGYNLVDIKT